MRYLIHTRITRNTFINGATMTFYDKIKWVLGILVVFVLIAMTNLIDRNNFIQVRNSVITIYEDRLIAKDLILDMYRKIHEKELALATSDASFFAQRNNTVNNEINDLISRFEQTKLTTEERDVFRSLKKNVTDLQSAEDNDLQDQNRNIPEVEEEITDIKEDLYRLSRIQLDEGKRQVQISQRAIDNVELFTQLEIYLLIILAIAIQIIVIYKPKEKKE